MRRADWGCLVVLAVVLAVDAAAYLALRALAVALLAALG